MISIKNLLHFSNFIAILCFISSSIYTYVLLTDNYSSLKMIIASFNLVMVWILSYIQYKPSILDSIILLHDTHQLFIVNFFIEFFCGLFMIGLGKINIGFGIIVIAISFYNMFFSLLYEHPHEQLLDQEEEN